MDIRNRIKRLQYKRGWTMYRLAKEADIPQSTLSNLFNRKNEPTVATLEVICKGFGISLSEFFAEEGELFSPTPEQTVMLNNWNKLSDIQKEKLAAFLESL